MTALALYALLFALAALDALAAHSPLTGLLLGLGLGWVLWRLVRGMRLE